MMSMTPDQFRKVGLGGVMPSPSPFLTPRPSRPRVIPDWNSNRQSERDSNITNKDKEINVQVVLRCRPLTDEEQRMNVAKVISCNEHKREVTVLQSVANKQIDKVFTFDKVFGPKAQQRSLYDQAIAPVVNEVLEGFNCTVFAFGQTGTGKTYTMEGGMRYKGGDLAVEAGVIPRAVRQIFDTLEAQNADYSMKVTFLELYNEEVTDLLAPDDTSKSSDERTKKPISLMEDGKGSVIVRGLEEEAVYSANEIYTLLERGAAKRRTADTLLNKRSSRSHSIFSITIYVKESAVGDEDLIKCGKLNLVDLAGSENISRCGAREGRVREAGEINKSLLTLGRVINALVEHSAHVPYRDSKLTRLLRDSLGGKTKTCIIATISPSAHSLEETLSTLDYAFRAKNIRNRPEVNQKMSKAVLLKDLYLEIERMKEDVRAAREKNGIYISHERFNQDEAEKKARIEKIEQLENELSIAEKEVDKYRGLYLTEQEQKLDVESELQDCKMNLDKNNKELSDLQEKHGEALSLLREQELLISKLLSSENSLVEHSKKLHANLHTASEDITSLFTKLGHKDEIEAKNQNMILTFGSHLDQSLKDLHRTILVSISQQQQQLRSMEEHVQSFVASKCDATKVLESKILKISGTYTSGVAVLKKLASVMQTKASTDLEQMNATFLSQIMAAEEFIAKAVMEAKEVVDNIQNCLNEQKQLLAFSSQQQEEGLKRSLVLAQVISKAAVNFFNDLHLQASKVITAVEENHLEKSSQFAHFEKMFKEEAARDEKQALEKIAAIVTSLTSKRIAMVSEASRNFQVSSSQDGRTIQQHMSNMQHVSCTAKRELNQYAQEAERQFIEDTFLVAESRAVMENWLQESSMKADYAGQQWETTQSYMNNLNKRSLQGLESAVKEKIRANCSTHEEFLSAVSYLDREFSERTSDVVASVYDSLTQDQKIKSEMDSVTTLSLDHLKSVQENHGTRVSSIRMKAEQCLTKDYLVGQHSGTTPKRRALAIPSLESIDAMRTPVKELNSENQPKRFNLESKIPPALHTASPNRAPFTNVN